MTIALIKFDLILPLMRAHVEIEQVGRMQMQQHSLRTDTFWGTWICG